MLTPYSRCLILAFATLATHAPAAVPSGFPLGTWISDEASSRSMGAKAQVLRITADDGRSLSFSLQETGSDGTTRVLKWSGVYGDAPHLIEGSAITFAVNHGPNGSILICGHRPEGIRFEEVCRVDPGRRRFRCDGTQWQSDGKQSTYVEIFNLQR